MLYIAVFNIKLSHFLTKIQKDGVQIFEAQVRILLIVDLSLNQTLLTFLLYVRQTWMAQLILEIYL